MDSLWSGERASHVTRASLLGLIVLIVIGLAGTARVAWQGPPPEPVQHRAPQRFADAVVAKLAAHPPEPILLRVPDRDAWDLAASVALALDREGLRFEVDNSNRLPMFGPYLTSTRTAPVVVSIAISGQPGFRRLASDRRAKLIVTGPRQGPGLYAAFVERS
jgi:hypothetical protein